MNNKKERVILRYIEDEVKDSYVDYAMSVIIGRALPDVRDGLKPVHRRILYAMKELGLEHNKPYKKSARIVGECFVEDTLVLTNKGLVPILDARRGDTVYTQNGINRVSGLYEMPPRKLLKVVLDNGTHNIVTPSQKFKVINRDFGFEWKEAKDLTNHDYIVVKASYPAIKRKAKLKRYNELNPGYLDEDLAYFLGFFMAEGWITKNKDRKDIYRVGFSCNSQETIEKIADILIKKFDYVSDIAERAYLMKGKHKTYVSYKYTIRTRKKYIVDFLRGNFDLDGLKAPTKTIPRQIFNSPKSVIFSFVSGLIDGDGSIHKNRSVIHYGSISEELIDRLLILLQHCGIFGAKYTSEKTRRGRLINERQISAGHKFYYLEFKGINAKLLASKLNLSNPQKQAALYEVQNRILKKSRYETVPYAGEIVFDELSKAHLGGGWYKSNDGSKFRRGIKYPTGCKIRYARQLKENPLRKSQIIEWGIKEKLKKIDSPLYNFLNHIIEEDIYFLRVSSVEETKAEKTYDLQVENEHEFVANGMISHNCLGKYHPHGDMAVYDTLVRMVQDFSLRYPLIDGQGNFGCFTKDTKIKLTDGRSLSFGELIQEEKNGKKNYTYTYNIKKQRIEIGQIKFPRLTKRKAKLIEVRLDNDEKIKCTPDHPFMLRDGTYREAKDLQPGDSLMPSEVGVNHSVKGIKRLGQKEDVYDLTIESTHNFALASGVFVHNSVDGDSAAALRYTEARLARITDEMLADIDKNTVDFVPNFDGSLQEPSVLPARLPNLLINGSSGIAVGMATNVPPHNLNEVVDAMVRLIDNPEISIEDLMKFIQGPDFPTGGFICGRDGIRDACRTGRGLLQLRAKAHVETKKGGRQAIIVTELPYQVNKASLIESIASLIENGTVEGTADLRDESDREGMRIVIDLRRDQNAQITLNQLYKHSQMQVTFGVIMLALVNNRPIVLNLKQMMTSFIDHREQVIQRRTTFELERAKIRAHILEGLKIALKKLDSVIRTIKSSQTTEVAKDALIKNFGLSAEQAKAILEMQLQRLTGLERKKVDSEYLELIKKIELYESILQNRQKVLDIIREELLSLKKGFGDERRTEILAEAEEFAVEDLIAEEDMVITISHSGYIKRLPVSSYRRQHRGGRGVTGVSMREEDFIEHLFIASTLDYILYFTDKGKVYWLKVHEIPSGGRMARGKAIVNLLQLGKGEAITSFVPVKGFDESHYLAMATKSGLIKKVKLSAFGHPRAGGIVAVTLAKDDRLIGAQLTDGKEEILLITKEGQAIRFKETLVRAMGRSAGGVRGVRLAKGDGVIAMAIVAKDATLLTVTCNGYGKRTKLSQYRTTGRGGKGVTNIKVTKKNGYVVDAKTVVDEDEVMIITGSGMVVRCPVRDIRAMGRNTQGVRVIALKDKDKLISCAKVAAKEEEEEEG